MSRFYPPAPDHIGLFWSTVFFQYSVAKHNLRSTVVAVLENEGSLVLDRNHLRFSWKSLAGGNVRLDHLNGPRFVISGVALAFNTD